MVREILNHKTLNSHVLNNFKLAMMNFDQQLFINTYNNLLNEKSFKEIFYGCFLPLLEEIGILWQTDTITPAHEHFMSSLIKQKILTNTEKLQATPPTRTDRVFVLYLPEGEIHEIGLLLINYELTLNGYKTIYIGESMPISTIKDLKNYFDNITYVTYITVDPSPGDVVNYLETVKKELIDADDHTELYLFGRLPDTTTLKLLGDKIKIFANLRDFSQSF